MQLIQPLLIKQNTYIEACWRDYLQINVFSDPVMVKQELKLTFYKHKLLEE